MARAGCVSLLFGSESKALKTPASHVLRGFGAIKAVAKSAPVSRHGRRRKPAFEWLLSGFRAGFRNLFKASGKGRGYVIRAWPVPGAFPSFFGGANSAAQKRLHHTIGRALGAAKAIVKWRCAFQGMNGGAKPAGGQVSGWFQEAAQSPGPG